MKMWSCEDRNAPFVDVFRSTAQANGYNLKIIEPNAVLPAGFVQLKAFYRHLSPNPERFELASFRRWFEIAAQVSPSDRFVLADSDLVIGLPFAKLPTEVRDFGGLVGSIGATRNILEDGINGGFSVWSGRMLRDFCDYMVAQYEAGTDQLAALHAKKIADGNERASISDMTLLYSWVKAAGIQFFNSNRLLRNEHGRNIYIDHNFFMPEAQGVRFDMSLGRKKLHWTEGHLLLQSTDGEPIIAASLHLGGRYKIMATDIAYRNKFGLTSKSIYILGGRYGRKLLARAGIHR